MASPWLSSTCVVLQRRQKGESPTVLRNACTPNSRFACGVTFAPTCLGPHLESEADAEGGDAEVENFIIKWRRFVENARGAAGDDDPRGSGFLYVARFHAGGVRNDRKDTELRQLAER